MYWIMLDINDTNQVELAALSRCVVVQQPLHRSCALQFWRDFSTLSTDKGDTEHLRKFLGSFYGPPGLASTELPFSLDVKDDNLNLESAIEMAHGFPKMPMGSIQSQPFHLKVMLVLV